MHVGGGEVSFFTRGVGKRYTSSYGHDMWPVKILERSGLAVNNVIIRKPWRRKKKKINK